MNRVSGRVGSIIERQGSVDHLTALIRWRVADGTIREQAVAYWLRKILAGPPAVFQLVDDLVGLYQPSELSLVKLAGCCNASIDPDVLTAKNYHREEPTVETKYCFAYPLLSIKGNEAVPVLVETGYTPVCLRVLLSWISSWVGLVPTLRMRSVLALGSLVRKADGSSYAPLATADRVGRVTVKLHSLEERLDSSSFAMVHVRDD